MRILLIRFSSSSDLGHRLAALRRQASRAAAVQDFGDEVRTGVAGPALPKWQKSQAATRRRVFGDGGPAFCLLAADSGAHAGLGVLLARRPAEGQLQPVWARPVRGR